MGNADGEGRPGLTGISAAAPILFELFGLLDTGEWFAPPEADLAMIDVCVQSGYPAGRNCGERKRIATVRTKVRPRTCPYCRIVHVDPSRKWRVHSGCERVADINALKWFVLPPAMEWYYKKRHSDYAYVPPLRDDCAASLEGFKTPSMSIIYPGKNGRIYIPIELDGRRGKTVFEATHRDAGATIHWHLDDDYLGATTGIHQKTIAPAPGMHLLTLVDENGERRERSFTVLSKE